MELKQLNSFEAACKVEGLDPKKALPDVSSVRKQDQKHALADAMLVIIVRAANRISNGGKEWTADHQNTEQVKYEPRFRRVSSGVRFHGYDIWHWSSGVRSRLCFMDYDAMVHVVTRPKFIKIYNDWLS